MKEIKAIFFDFDWTLFDHKTKSFNLKSIKALKKLHKKGIKLIINSARTYYSLKNLHTFDVYPFDGFVVSNGGAAIFENKILYFDGFKKEIVSKLLDFLDRKNLSYNLVTLYNTYNKNKDIDMMNNFYKIFYEPFPIDIASYNNEDVLAIQVFSLERDDKELINLCEELNLKYNRFSEYCIEITPIEFEKSKGIKEIIKYLNITKDEIMAFGDDLNDISMFKEAKYSICLGNGKQELKDISYYVTDNIEKDGIYKALKFFKLIK